MVQRYVNALNNICTGSYPASLYLLAMLFNEEYRHYRSAVIFSLVFTLITFVFVLFYGKEDSFLIINKYNSPQFDYFFMYLTYLGDGIIWVPIFVYVLLWRRSFLIPLIASVIICTILTHMLKRVVFADEMRPVVILQDRVRTIEGVVVNRAFSFPSGHTSTAFTLALLFTFLIKRWFWTIFFPLIAFFVGYSRVYLAQHFVTDVCAGMVVGIISSYLSLLVFEKVQKRKMLRQESEEKEIEEF